MTWLASIFVAFLTGLLGLFCARAIMSACVKWYRISSFEGGAGYAVVFTALLGGVAGLVIGLVTARLVAAGTSPGFLKGLAFSWGGVLVISVIATALSWLLADIPPKIDGQELMLEVELRLPVGETNSPVSYKEKSSLEFGSVVNHRRRSYRAGELKIADARLEDGRWVIPGEVFLFTMRGYRSLSIELDGQSRDGFLIPLPARPGKEFEQWSPWGPRGRSKTEPWPDTKLSYRFRVQRIVPPPPGPTVEEIAAQEAAKEQAVFDAVAPDAPIKDWLPYTRYGAPEARLQKAVANITARSRFIEELSALMFSEEQEDAKDALYLIEHIPQPPAEFNAPVAEAGRRIAALIRKVNATTVEQDPSYLGAADVSIRFSAWMVAVRTLREKSGGDFTPELGEILKLSRVREDSYVMRQDVRRVASYYMSQWTGLAPLPTDPKPR